MKLHEARSQAGAMGGTAASAGPIAPSGASVPKNLLLGLPKISQFWKIVGGGGFSHYLNHSEFSGGKINEIEKCIGVANRN